MARMKQGAQPASKTSQTKEQKQEKTTVHNPRSQQQAAAQASIPKGQKSANGGSSSSNKAGPKASLSQNPSVKSLTTEQLARLSELLHNITASSAALQAEFSFVPPDTWQELIDNSFRTTPASAPTGPPAPPGAPPATQRAGHKPTPPHILQIQHQDMALIARYGSARLPMTPDEIESTRAALWRYWGWAPDKQTMQAAKATAMQHLKRTGTPLCPYETPPWTAARRVMWNRKGRIWELRAELDRARAAMSQVNESTQAADDVVGETKVLPAPPVLAAHVAQRQALLAGLVKEEEKDQAHVLAAFQAVGLRQSLVRRETFPVAELVSAPPVSNPQPADVASPQPLQTPAIRQAGQEALKSASADAVDASPVEETKEGPSEPQREEHQKPIADKAAEAQAVAQRHELQRSTNDEPLTASGASKTSPDPVSGLTEAAATDVTASPAEPKTPEMLGEDVPVPADVVDLQDVSSTEEENDADDEGEEGDEAKGDGGVSPLKRGVKHWSEEMETGPAKKKVKI